MANELAVRSRTIPSLPEWLPSFESGMNGDPLKPTARRPLTEAERSEATQIIAAVERSLTPAQDAEVLTYVARLLLAFPAQQVSETAAKIRSEAYLTALGEFPAWAIERAAEMWLRRQEPEGNENYAFAPSPPQMVRLCRIAMSFSYALKHRLERAMRAEPECQFSDDHRGRMLAKLAGHPALRKGEAA